MRELDQLFQALSKSAFRQRFHLQAQERAYLAKKGLPTVLRHAHELVDRRLAPAHPANDGRQTPLRGHPVFIAQHATATCCRGCLAKWHHIAAGHALTDAERDHVVAVLERWLRSEAPDSPGDTPVQMSLFK
jgi:predicted Fe-S protein YdhL (DUF1289 family)